MKKQLKSVISLFAICSVIAIALAFTNALTQPLILKAEEAKANEALLEVLPSGEEFVKEDITLLTNLPKTVTEVYREKNGGYVFKLETTGYGSGMVIMCGINPDGTVSGTKYLSGNETHDAKNTYGSNFLGKGLADVESVPTTSRSTKTTQAYKNAIKDALISFTNLNGGSVDVRTEEEILLDNLSTALPAAEGKFTLTFVAEVLDGIDRVYGADNGSGRVFVFGERFIATDSNGKAITNADNADLASPAEAADAQLNSSVATTIDLSVYPNLPKAVKEASKTESGNFILVLTAQGYGTSSNYGTSGQPIRIQISMTSEGKIINCQTISQAESERYGDKCAEPSFYTQYNGKTQDNYVNTISGATYTTNGYNTAVLRAFEAVKILTGGNVQ